MTTPKYENLDTAENWIEWNGGDCPVAADARVEYMMRGPNIPGPFTDVAADLDWRHGELGGSEVVAYRVLRAPESQCPAHGGGDVDVANLFWDRLFTAKIRLILDVDSEDDSNALPLVVGFGSTEGGVDSILLHAEVDGKPVSLAIPAQLSTDAEGDAFVRVPREATEKMVNAARGFSVPGYCMAAEQWPAVWRAMLAAHAAEERQDAEGGNGR